MDELLTGAHYDERGTQAVHSVLIELAQILGAQQGNFVLVGGAVPGILLDNAVPQHAGTLDLDIQLNPEKMGRYGYVNMIEELESHGYERNINELRSFQMERRVNVDEGDPIPVIIDLLRPKGVPIPQREEKVVEGLHVQEIDGGEIALAHSKPITLEGKMPDGRKNKVAVQVATIPALLVMKGYAIANRSKEKDAYDIWYSICHSDSDELIAGCRLLMGNEVAREGYELITGKFESRDSYGPQTVRKFLEDRPDQLNGKTLDQIQTDAFMRVQDWYEKITSV